MLSISSRPALRSSNSRRGSVFVEYVLLVTLIGLGTLVGVAVLRNALINELSDLANAIQNIIP